MSGVRLEGKKKKRRKKRWKKEGRTDRLGPRSDREHNLAGELILFLQTQHAGIAPQGRKGRRRKRRKEKKRTQRSVLIANASGRARAVSSCLIAINVPPSATSPAARGREKKEKKKKKEKKGTGR